MKEIFQKLNRQPYTEKTEIEFETNPQNIVGASMTKEHRLVYFEKEQTEPFYIDFVPHKGVTDCIFIIPAGHLLYFPNSTTNFHCIYIPHKCLNNIEKYWIYNLKYKNQKSIILNHSKINFNGKSLTRIITQIFDSVNEDGQNIPSLQYIQQAELLNNNIYQTVITHQFSINDWTEILNTTRKTVLRICSLVFDETPTKIIRYHLFLSIIFQIISCQMQPLSEVANNLGFRDLSTFNRYVKTISGYTPKELRENYNHIKLL